MDTNADTKEYDIGTLVAFSGSINVPAYGIEDRWSAFTSLLGTAGRRRGAAARVVQPG